MAGSTTPSAAAAAEAAVEAAKAAAEAKEQRRAACEAALARAVAAAPARDALARAERERNAALPSDDEDADGDAHDAPLMHVIFITPWCFTKLRPSSTFTHRRWRSRTSGA